MMKKVVVIAALMFTVSTPCSARSTHRIQRHTPTLIARWHDEPNKAYFLRNEALELHQLFHTFDKEHFLSHQLPKKLITHRNSSKATDGKKLSALVENLVKEIGQKKKKFTDFTVLQNKNYNKRRGYGLLVLKFKDYPFVLKLFLETPQSFVKPHSKGFEPRFIFMLSGGINRHLAGLTRVKNLETINKKLASDPQWGSIIDTPRKWFWLPTQPKYLALEGVNISGPDEHQTVEIPAIYGIIADAITADRRLSMVKKQDTKLAMDLCNFLDQNIDAHIDNFLIEQETKKIVIVDTEHFPTLIGMKEKFKINSYFDYYSSLSWKCLQKSYLLTKRERKERRLAKTISC